MKESENREFKKSLAELKTALISIAAILNKHGRGEIWFGVSNDGRAVGLDATDKTLRDVSQSIAAHIDPRIYPEVTLEEVDGVSCIKVSFEGGDKPYYAQGRAYMRVADEDRQLSARELENIIVSRNQERLRWDNQPCTLQPSELNEAKVRKFVERAGLRWDSVANAMDKLGLMRNGALLNAARLFFTDEPMELRCAVFGTTTSGMIIDRHDIHGDILELIEEAQKYVLKNIHIGMKLEGLYRRDVPEISTDAMREAIINAFCHRDYRDPDYVHVAVFKDRVEIRNPGPLYGGITIDDLRNKGHISKRRNPLIADLFRRIEMVEAWGRGMPLIFEQEPGVQFREIADIFIAAFDRPSFKSGFMEENAPDKSSVKSSVKTQKKSSVRSDIKSSVRSVGINKKMSENGSPETVEKTVVKSSPETSVKRRNIPENVGKSEKTPGKSVSAVEKTVVKNSPTVEKTVVKSVPTVGETVGETSVKSSVKSSEKTSVKASVKTSVKASVKASVKTSVKTSVKASVKTSVKILNVVRHNPDITIPQLADLSGVTARSVERNIQRMQQAGKLRRIGPDKGGHWEVVK